MELSSTSSSVWPGYVAAVSSLVLSLLLLAGVLVVSISQASRIVDAYNKKLIRSVILDEQRELELQRLRREPADAKQATLWIHHTLPGGHESAAPAKAKTGAPSDRCL